MKKSIQVQDNISVSASLKMEDVGEGQLMWKRKYEELERCLSRIQKLYDGLIISGQGEDSLQSPKDYVMNFFRVAYELKEMLAKDPNVPISKSEIEQFVRSNRFAGLSIDIANQKKHGIWGLIQGFRKTNHAIDIISSHIHILSPDGRNRTEVTIEIDGNKEDCLQLAKNVFNAWCDFMHSKNLL